MSVNNTHFGSAEISRRLERCNSVFFIGAGGINMSSLALITKNRGLRVGGSDRTKTALTEKLESAGIEMHYCHDEKNVAGYDAVVYTVAISPDNPEYKYALENGLLCISRADYLGFVMTAWERRIGICGMHGKSTCTSMCAQVFLDAKTDATVLSGAELDIMDGAYHIGQGSDFIFEACEYMDSFLDFNPTIAVVLNIEMDHVDYFHSMEQIYSSFAKFTSITGEDGYVIANLDDEDVKIALRGYKGHIITFGKSDDADFRAINVEYNLGRPKFDVLKNGEFLCHIELSVAGEHNVYNALATAAAATLCGIAPEDIVAGLRRYHGAKRRMELKGFLSGAPVYDDYGHHPTEVKTTLDGASRMGERHLWTVFQPHTYSRTAALWDDLIRSFDSCHKVIFADIYAARENDTLGVSAEKLAQALGDRGLYLGDNEKIAKYLKANVEKDDLVVVMGAGDIYRLYDLLDLTEE